MNIKTVWKVVSNRQFLKRLGITFLIIAPTNYALIYFGFQPGVVTLLLVSVVSAYFVDLMLLSSLERRKRFFAVKEHLESNWFVYAKSTLWVAAVVLLYGATEMPTNEFVKAVYKLVHAFGFLAVLISVTATMVFGYSGSLASGLIYSITKALSGIGVWVLSLWCIGAFGDDLYSWVIDNPEESKVAAATMFFIWTILRFSKGSVPRPAAAYAGVAQSAIFRPAPTEKDVKYIAAHEAGHALVYAALPRLPIDVEVVIKDSNNGSLGYVTGLESKDQLTAKTFSEWKMLVFLAGKKGEAFAFGESTLGSSQDHDRWVQLARGYLANHYEGVFYATPQNEFEQAANDKKLESLQKYQLSLLDNLFVSNEEIFNEIASALEEKRTLKSDEITTYLSRVSLPDAFPSPDDRYE